MEIDDSPISSSNIVQQFEKGFGSHRGARMDDSTPSFVTTSENFYHKLITQKGFTSLQKNKSLFSKWRIFGFDAYFDFFSLSSFLREIIQLTDGQVVALDWLETKESYNDPDKPTILILPGLNGKNNSFESLKQN